MKKVLLIEDDNRIRENLRDAFMLSGFDVQDADNGARGLSLANSFQPDIIFCDIMMKGMDGYDVLNAIKSDERFLLTPFVFISARSEKDAVRKGMNLGATDYLIKPFELSEIIEVARNKTQIADTISQKVEWAHNELAKSIENINMHEFNTPLNGIITASMLMQDSIKNNDSEESLELLQAIWASAKRLHRTLSNISAYNLMISGRHEVFMEKVFCSQVITMTSEIRKRHFRVDDLILSIEDDFQLTCDRYLLQLLLNELLDNAFKYTQAGDEIQLTFTQNPDGSAQMKLAYPNKNGFTKEMFDSHVPYVQYKRPTLEQQGIGLGLPIIKEIVHLLNMELSYSGENRKSEFTLLFPHNNA